MATKRKAARKAAAPKPVISAAVREKAAALGLRAALERHGGTALELRLQAVELVLAELTK